MLFFIYTYSLKFINLLYNSMFNLTQTIKTTHLQARKKLDVQQNDKVDKLPTLLSHKEK